MLRFASLDWAAIAASGVLVWFATLTTPMEYWGDPQHVYLSLRRFRRCFLRDHPEVSGVFVRRELGAKRGMLHYHLVIIGGEGLKGSYIQRLWTTCLGHTSPVRVDIQVARNGQELSRYLAKYCSKAAWEGAERARQGSGGADTAARALSNAHNGTGDRNGARWWYVWGNDTLPWAEQFEAVGVEAAALAKRIRRIFRRWQVSVVAKRVDKHMKCSGFAFNRFSVRHMGRNSGFGEWLRRCGDGFTLLCDPDLLDKMAAAAMDGVEWSLQRG